MKSFGSFNPNEWQVEIIPCPYDKTTSYGHGTDKGPEGIIEASQELEFYDDEYAYDPSSCGIKTLESVTMDLQDASTKEPFKALEDFCTNSYQRAKFPIVLGGEHSLSLAPIQAAYKYLKAQGESMTLLHFDAHADLRQEYLGNPYSHAAAIYQVYKHCPDIKIVSVGIRNISEGEVKWLGDLEHESKSRGNIAPIQIFYACDENKHNRFSNSDSNTKSPCANPDWSAQDVIDAMSKFNNENFYITFDVDGFDSAVMPSTGTPEPGGLDWYTPLSIIKEATKKFNLVGADVVELAPIQNFHGPDFLVAKLIYKIIAAKFAK